MLTRPSALAARRPSHPPACAASSTPRAVFGAPVYAAWYVREAGDCAPFTLVMLLVAVWLHLPWSVAYHAVCAVRKARPLPKGMKVRAAGVVCAAA